MFVPLTSVPDGAGPEAGNRSVRLKAGVTLNVLPDVSDSDNSTPSIGLTLASNSSDEDVENDDGSGNNSDYAENDDGSDNNSDSG